VSSGQSNTTVVHHDVSKVGSGTVDRLVGVEETLVALGVVGEGLTEAELLKTEEVALARGGLHN
jgi:hypothetical protein